MRVLVLAAHPDDEVLGCGGTIARLSAEGHEVHIAILGEGITSRYQNRDHADMDDVAALHLTSHKVGEVLGAQKIHLYGLPDNRFDSVPLLDVVKHLEQLIGDFAPEEIYTQHGGDLNIDHQILFRATLTATRPMKNLRVRRVYAYEVQSSTEWAFQQFSPVFTPNTFVDISATLEKKLSAMRLYESEARAFPHPRSSEAIRSYALRWGSVSGLDAAEAFELIREIK